MNNYLSDDEEYNTNTIEEPYEISISYDKNYIEYDSNEENIDDMNDEEKIEYLEHQEYLKNQKILIWQNNIKKNISDTTLYKEKEKEINIKEPKKSKSMNFLEFNNFIDKKIEDSKPKKFVSQRLLNKKPDKIETKETNIKSNKRNFNPRLPPYFHIYSR
jgi:hypothetical protein